MYNIYQNPNALKLTFEEFITYSDYLVKNDEDGKNLSDENTKDTINKLMEIREILNSSNTKEELYDKLTSPCLSDLTNDVDMFSISEIYGLYYYDSILDDTVSFNVMLDFIVYLGENVDEFKNVIDQESLQNLKLISNQINQKIQDATTPMTKEVFQGYMYQTYGTVLSEQDVTNIYNSYFLSKGQEVKETIPYLELMVFLVESNIITDEESCTSISNAQQEYIIVTSKYSYDKFIPTLANVIYASTGSLPSLDITNDDIRMIYIYYFDLDGQFDELAIDGTVFVQYVKSLYEEDEYMKEQIGASLYENICSMGVISSHLNDEVKYNYIDQLNNLETIKKSINVALDLDEMDLYTISGVYIKYETTHNNNLLNPICAEDLLNFVNQNKDTNTLLKKKLDSEKLEKIDDANSELNTANSLFKGDKYSRILISMDLDLEGEECERFVEYLKETSTKYFGEDSYIAGEAVSNYDLKESFKTDEILISIVTIISILLIVAITFRSVSIPLILVLVIQGACYIAFSSNFITGPVFFMSYIISSCILMGATVDYGILLSTNYIKNRATMDKDESIKQAIDASLPTIFTSGLILTICGFAIAFLSTQSTISSVGLLVGKGGLTAIILVLFLLPSLIYLLDKVILKTTYHKK